MFFLTYLKRELRRRMRQAIFIAVGLAVGIGLVITVIGASNGVKHAQNKVLADLYGIGTDLTVTTTPQRPSSPGQGQSVQIGTGPGSGNSNGPTGQECTNGKCHALKGGDVIDTLAATNYGSISTSELAAIEHLAHVKSVTGGLILEDNRIVIPASNNGTLPEPSSVSVDGVDPSHETAGPIANAALTKGRNLTAKDTTDALVDANYATSHDLKIGGTVTLANTKFTIVGLVSQPEATSPPNVYVPLAEAQKLSIDPATSKSLTGKVDTIYVTADNASDIGTVQHEIQHLMSGATVTTEASLASQITGNLASTAKLANELGKWLAILVLIAAFAVASLLTLAAVARRTPEFGTLKALGWRGRRIVGQLLGESVTTGIVGGLLGIGLGFGGVAIINKVAHKLTATVPTANGNGGGFQAQSGTGAGPVSRSIDPAATAHATVSVPMSASVTVAAIVLAVVLAIAGGLLAGSFGGWRAARLRPAAALAKVG
jgi:putative ABC transport system permease protein